MIRQDGSPRADRQESRRHPLIGNVGPALLLERIIGAGAHVTSDRCNKGKEIEAIWIGGVV